jgi:hypothetical protein
VFAKKTKKNKKYAQLLLLEYEQAKKSLANWRGFF